MEPFNDKASRAKPEAFPFLMEPFKLLQSGDKDQATDVSIPLWSLSTSKFL